MILKYLSIAIFICILASCSGEQEVKVQPPPDDSAQNDGVADKYASDKVDDFNKKFKLILASLMSKDKGELSKYVSPEFGLLIIKSDGAMPSFLISKYGLGEYNKALETIFTGISLDCELLNECLPRIDCDKVSHWSKSGCFVRDTNALAGSDIWKFGGLNDDDQAFTQKVIQAVGRTVVVTKGFTFYFTYHNNDWYLALIDIRKPCNA